MARRGSFGRVPRAAPSLTSTIIAIAREMQAARDRNIMDAWQNGGLFEGKKVSDAMVLKHWRERMKHVDKDDPKWDEYNNKVMQLDYTIHEQTTYTAYMQGKISDNTMAKFYLDWAKRVPRDSQFYRELQQDAARFLEAGKAKARAAAKKAEEDAYQAAQATTLKDASVGEFLEWAIEGIAKSNGLVGLSDSKGLANLSNPTELVGIVDMINVDPNRPLFEVNGVVWTGNDFFAELAKRDPSFAAEFAGPTGLEGSATPWAGSGSRLTWDYIEKKWKQQDAAYGEAATRATNTGHKEDGNALNKLSARVSGNIRGIGVWGVAPAYDQIIARRDRILNNPLSSGSMKSAALTAAAEQLAVLSRTEGLDLRTSETLLIEAAANNGDRTAANRPTFREDYLGTKTKGYSEGGVRSSSVDPETGESVPAGENASISSLAATLQGEINAVSQSPNQFTYTTGTRDPKTNSFKADPEGKEIGVASIAEVEAQGAALVVMPVQQGDGSVIGVTVSGKPIHTVAYDAYGNEIDPAHADGTKLDNGDIGWVYEAGGVTLFQIKDNKGEWYFTPINPYGGNNPATRNQDGSYTVNATQAAGAAVVEGFDGTIYYNPAGLPLTAVTDAAGRNVTTMFSTPFAAGIAAMSDPEAAASYISRNPELRDMIQGQAEVYANGDEARFIEISEENARAFAGAVGATLRPRYVVNPNSLTVEETTDPMGISRPEWDLGALNKIQEIAKSRRDARYGEDTRPGTPRLPGPENMAQPKIKLSGTIAVPDLPKNWSPGQRPEPQPRTPVFGTPAAGWPERSPRPSLPTPAPVGPSGTGASGSLLPPETEDKWTVAQRTAKPTSAPRAW